MSWFVDWWSHAAVAGALTLVALPWTARVVELIPVREGVEGDPVEVGSRTLVWTQINPWDEQGAVLRRDGCELFNRGLFLAAAKMFHDIERLVAVGRSRCIGHPSA